MAKGPGCFYCKWHTDGVIQEPGLAYKCAKGLDTSAILTKEDVLKCPQGATVFGFQIGGYYTHMELVVNDPEQKHNSCLEWRIWSDGEFPQGEPAVDPPSMEFHLCNFEQLKEWVEWWSKVLRKSSEGK